MTIPSQYLILNSLSVLSFSHCLSMMTSAITSSENLPPCCSQTPLNSSSSVVSYRRGLITEVCQISQGSQVGPQPKRETFCCPSALSIGAATSAKGTTSPSLSSTNLSLQTL